jgi:hypothetical protein
VSLWSLAKKQLRIASSNSRFDFNIVGPFPGNRSGPDLGFDRPLPYLEPSGWAPVSGLGNGVFGLGNGRYVYSISVCHTWPVGKPMTLGLVLVDFIGWAQWRS